MYIFQQDVLWPSVATQILLKDPCYGCSKTDSQTTFYYKLFDSTNAHKLVANALSI